jgi:hypothetical protein
MEILSFPREVMLKYIAGMPQKGEVASRCGKLDACAASRNMKNKNKVFGSATQRLRLPQNPKSMAL